MKKFTSFILVLTILFSVLSLTSCSENTSNETNTVEYEKIELTTQNYSKYLSITLTFSDSQFEHNGTKYDISCMGTIKTKAMGDYKFEWKSGAANISYDLLFNSSWEKPVVGPSVEINIDGTSEASFFLHKQSSYLDFPTSARYPINVKSINGYVLVPKTT